MAKGASESTSLGGVNLDALDDEPQFETPQRNETDVELPEESYADDYDSEYDGDYDDEYGDEVTDYAANSTPWYMRLWQNDIARRAIMGVGAVAIVVSVFTITNSMTSDETAEKGSGEVVAPEQLSADEISARGQRADEDKDAKNERRSRIVDNETSTSRSAPASSTAPGGVSRVSAPSDVYNDEPASEPSPAPQPQPEPQPQPQPAPQPQPQPQPQPAPQPQPQPQPTPSASPTPQPDTSRAESLKRLMDRMGKSEPSAEKTTKPTKPTKRALPQATVSENGAVETVYQTPDR